jgi:hypothetical protein
MLWLSLLLLMAGAEDPSEGRRVQLHWAGTAFQILEPEGWTLDTGSGLQLAQFLFHPAETSWRRADAVIFGRFVERRAGETVEDFLEENRQEFLATCLAAEPVVEDRTVPGTVEPFVVQVYHCPGTSREVVAVAPGPRFFIVLALSARDSKGLTGALPIYDRIVASFEWFGRPGMLRMWGEPGEQPPQP